jgi:hypothetical protein
MPAINFSRGANAIEVPWGVGFHNRTGNDIARSHPKGPNRKTKTRCSARSGVHLCDETMRKSSDFYFVNHSGNR